MRKPAFLELNFRIPLDSFELVVEESLRHFATGVFGPSGSGKTTLLATIAGLGPPADGFIRCEDAYSFQSSRDQCLRPEQRGIGYVPQDHLLFDHLSVHGNLKFGAQRTTGASPVDFDKVVDLLELRPLLPRSVRSLSGGEKQRVSLGRALCSNPRLLLLDEPLSSLDERLRRRILPFLIRIRESFEIPLLIVSHNPAEILAVCDEALLLEKGRIEARGDPVDVLTAARGLHRSLHLENILKVEAEAATDREVRPAVTRSGQRIFLPKSDGSTTGRLHIGIQASDILVSVKDGTGTSARNRIRSRIQSMESTGEAVLLSCCPVGSKNEPILVEVTRAAVNELDLRPEKEVTLLFKTRSIQVYG